MNLICISLKSSLKSSIMALTNLPYISNQEKTSLTNYLTVGTSRRESLRCKRIGLFFFVSHNNFLV